MLAYPVHASAQDQDEEDAPRRTRVALGPQFVPSYPGSDAVSLRPLFDLSRTRGDKEFDFEAPDESFGFPIFRSDKFSFGPSAGLEGKRTASEVGTVVPKVGFSVELGAFAQYDASENFRLRAEARQGVSGHDGFISVLSADAIVREGDNYLVSVGPRVTITDKNYQQAYFGIAPEDVAASGLEAYDPGGGVQSLGAAAGYLYQFTPRWGIYSFAKYDRLVGDAADSPLVRQYGSRDQFSGGIALSYTFGEGVE